MSGLVILVRALARASTPPNTMHRSCITISFPSLGISMQHTFGSVFLPCPQTDRREVLPLLGGWPCYRVPRSDHSQYMASGMTVLMVVIHEECKCIPVQNKGHIYQVRNKKTHFRVSTWTLRSLFSFMWVFTISCSLAILTALCSATILACTKWPLLSSIFSNASEMVSDGSRDYMLSIKWQDQKSIGRT